MIRFAQRFVMPTVGLVFLGTFGCQPTTTNYLTDSSAPLSPGPAAGRVPVINFTAPTESFDLKDSETAAIAYRVIADQPTTVKLFLDADLIDANNNEMDLAPMRANETADASDQVALTAALYPYGTYFIRATVSDGQRQASYIAPGSVRIIPSNLQPGEDPSTSDLTGLVVLHDAGDPEPIDGRVPFADLWWELDVLDNLAPRAISPVEFTHAVDLHALQVYTFGRPELTPRRVDIYRGTDETTAGELLHRIDVDAKSHFAGKWVTVRFDPAVHLEPGKYGVAYHSRFEFTERVAANSPNGPGYVWVSPFGGSPFRKVDATGFGFTPNFAIRLYGTTSGPAAARGRAVETRRHLRLMYRNGEERRSFRPEEDAARELQPLHIFWRQVMPE